MCERKREKKMRVIVAQLLILSIGVVVAEDKDRLL